MLDILKRGRDESGYTAVKAEFEAEGTRTDELLRLIEIARKADLGVGLKIGGCEAVRDLLESKQFGVEYVIAPMIESPYALSKYIQATNAVYTAEEREDTRFLFNLETETAYQSLSDLANAATQPNGVDGIVFGRVDFTLSRGLSRDDINTEEITKCCLVTADVCRSNHLDFVLGGGVSRDSLGELALVHGTHLSRFETRKIIFDASVFADSDRDADSNPVALGLLAAVHFEMLWLLNKQDYYNRIAAEDNRRIDMLERRWRVLQQESGG